MTTVCENQVELPTTRFIDATCLVAQLKSAIQEATISEIAKGRAGNEANDIEEFFRCSDQMIEYSGLDIFFDRAGRQVETLRINARQQLSEEGRLPFDFGWCLGRSETQLPPSDPNGNPRDQLLKDEVWTFVMQTDLDRLISEWGQSRLVNAMKQLTSTLQQRVADVADGLPLSRYERRWSGWTDIEDWLNDISKDESSFLGLIIGEPDTAPVRRINFSGIKVKLTPSEKRLLRLYANNGAEGASKVFLTEQWGNIGNTEIDSESNTIHQANSSLRRKLKPLSLTIEKITTPRGPGWCLKNI